jgi:S1-C subfamily serine protease
MIRFIALVCGITFSLGTARAEDEPGSIGVKLKLEDGKIVVDEPIKDSPAEKAGIKAGDIILKLNDYKVKDDAEMEDLTDLVKEVVKQKPGEKVKVAIKRDGKDMTIEVTVGKRSEVIKETE